MTMPDQPAVDVAMLRQIAEAKIACRATPGRCTSDWDEYYVCDHTSKMFDSFGDPQTALALLDERDDLAARLRRAEGIIERVEARNNHTQPYSGCTNPRTPCLHCFLDAWKDEKAAQQQPAREGARLIVPPEIDAASDKLALIAATARIGELERMLAASLGALEAEIAAQQQPAREGVGMFQNDTVVTWETVKNDGVLEEPTP